MYTNAQRLISRSKDYVPSNYIYLLQNEDTRFLTRSQIVSAEPSQLNINSGISWTCAVL